MSSLIGAPVTRSGYEVVLDPVDGYRTREVWRGTKAQLVGVQAALNSVGLRSSLEEDEGRVSLRFDISGVPGGEDTETPIEKWTWNKDYVQESLWSSKRIIDLLEVYRALLQTTYGGTFLLSDIQSQVRRDSENALKGLRATSVASEVEQGLPTGAVVVGYEEVSKGPLTPAETGFSGKANATPLNIYKLMLLGADSYEVERLVLTRSRTFSIRYASRVVMLETPRVYSTAALVTAENIPAVTQAQFPATPANAPENTVWAWKVRQDRSEVSSNGKVDEVRDWVFAAWSTLLYEYIP